MTQPSFNEGLSDQSDRSVQSSSQAGLNSAGREAEDRLTATRIDRQNAVTTQTEPDTQVIRDADSPTLLFSKEDAGSLRTRWTGIQTAFVDEPRWAVKEADKLVAEIVEHLTESFTNAKSILEQQWNRGDDASTEDLRLALQRYRALFDQLLNV